MHDSAAKIFPRTIGNTGRIRYSLIVDSIERAIASGRLSVGERLPTQRALAEHLGTAVGTVGRAYSEAERRGLIVGEVGRGTYACKLDDNDGSAALASHNPIIDLTISRPPNEGAARHFANALRSLSKRRDIGDLLGNEPANGWLRHRLAGAKWISGRGILVSADDVFACNGVQHALSVILAALCKAGDAIATEDLNYPGIRLLANLYGLRLIGVPMDDEGMRVDALERVCQRERVVFLLCSPTIHNPTTITMSIARRRRIVEVAKKHDLTIIENDILGMMPVEPLPAVASMARERCCYVTGLTKVVATGLRLGFIAAPATLLKPLITAFHSTAWMPPSLMSEIFTLWVEDGSIKTIIDWHRREARARVELAQRVLGRSRFRFDDASYYLWLQMPAFWKDEQFADAARARGVSVLPAKTFAVNRESSLPQAVRVSLGGVNNRERLEKSLRMLTKLLAEGPSAIAAKMRKL